ncbi:hypothetical protein [Roseococcus sp. YIM B11640]|uniref:hypothetical protein n=1 Tax=Roseococcus sp. YIM B11640 TaxID=3133973 RepID=UPI003C7D511F
MRWVLVLGVGLALSGCANPHLQTAEQAAAERAFNDEYRRRNEARMTPDEVQQRNAAVERTRQAEIICQNRGRAAAAQPAFGGPGMPGLANAMVSQEMAGNAVASACWDTFQRTGVMPSY